MTAAPQKAVNHWLGDTTMMLAMMMMTMRRDATRDARCKRTIETPLAGEWIMMRDR